MLDFLLICFSIGLLIWGSVITIRSAVTIAQEYGLSDLFIGLIILSIGSDLPELVVTITASFDSLSGNDMSGIIVGASIGSAFTQMGLVLGITGLMTYLVTSKRNVYLVGSLVIISIIVLMLTGYDLVIDWVDGLILLSVYCIYLFVVMFDRTNIISSEKKAKTNHLKTWSLLIIGLVVIAISAELVVDSAANLAIFFGMSQSLVAVLIIGPGTSLPELAIALSAIKNKRHYMSIGNILGSNVFDTLIPIGVAALISPVFLEKSYLIYDLPGLIFLSFITLFFLRRKRGIQKIEALVLIIIYCIYLVSKLVEIYW
jgi:cation:H+ antiporter